MLSDNFITTLIILLVILVSLYYIFGSSQPIHNEGALQNSNPTTTNYVDDGSEESSDADTYYSKNSENTSEVTSNPDETVDSSIDIINERARGRDNIHFNRLSGGKYKRSSFKDIDSGF